MSNLQEAFRESVAREFASIPDESELHYVFSRRFERKMRRMIRAQVHGYWRLVNTAAKRAAVAAAIILLLLTSAMAIKPIRERVIKFFVEVYEEYFEISFGESTPKDLPELTEPIKRYSISELPQGYREVEHQESDMMFWTHWRDEANNSISLHQESGTQDIVLDNSTTEPKIVIYNNLKIIMYENQGAQVHCWEQFGYVFKLTTYEPFSDEEIQNMIFSLKIIE